MNNKWTDALGTLNNSILIVGLTAVVKSIRMELENRFTVYPYPTVDNMMVTLTMVQEGDVTDELIDALGKVIICTLYTHIQKGNNQIEMNSPHIANGNDALVLKTAFNPHTTLMLL